MRARGRQVRGGGKTMKMREVDRKEQTAQPPV